MDFLSFSGLIDLDQNSYLVFKKELLFPCAAIFIWPTKLCDVSSIWREYIHLTAHFIFSPEAWVRSGKTQAVIRNSLALTWLFSLTPCVAWDAGLEQFFKTASERDCQVSG